MRKLKSVFALVLVMMLSMNYAFAGIVEWEQPDGDVNVLNIQSEKLENNASPKYIILLIGDGLGFSQRQIAEYYNQTVSKVDGQLSMNQLPIAGVNTTHSANSLITDSAAAGTALASAVKTNNGVIGKDADLNDVKTLVELAEEKGLATGLVSTTRLTHATPAAFASHNESRGNENEIAEDLLASGVDFFAGGGLRYFIPQGYSTNTTDYSDATIKSKRKDDRDLVKEFEDKGYTIFIGRKGTDAFETATFNEGDQVFAAFTYSHMPYEIDRVNSYSELPSLADMTDKALDLLSTDEDGFFLMVEGGRIDHAAHANDAASMVQDVLAFDEAVESALDFYRNHKDETLVLVVGDHETGGLGLGMDTHGYFVDVKALESVKMSSADLLSYKSDIKYSGDRDALMRTLETSFGLNDLTEAEIMKLNTAMSAQDKGQTFGYYDADPVPMTVAHILSTRANIFWTTTIHTSTAIPLTTIGVDSNKFLGYVDNTDISKTLADIMGVSFE